MKTARDKIIELVRGFIRARPECADAVADWMTWCLPRGLDPTIPLPPDAASLRHDIPAGVRALWTWCRSKRRSADTPSSTRRSGGRPGPTRTRDERISTEATWLLLRSAAERHEGHLGTAALFLLAADPRINLGELSWLDVANLIRSEAGQRLLMPTGPVIDLAPVVGRQVSAHLAAVSDVREVTTIDGRARTPLLRNRAGNRAAASTLHRAVQAIRADAGVDRIQIDGRTRFSISAVDLFAW